MASPPGGLGSRSYPCLEAGRSLGERLRETGIGHALRGVGGPDRFIPEAGELEALAAGTPDPGRGLLEMACLGRALPVERARQVLGAPAYEALRRAGVIAEQDGRASWPEHALFATPCGWLVGDRPLGYPGVPPRAARAFADDESLALAVHVARAAPVGRALDLGCGAGLTALAAAASAERVVAVDVQEESIRAAWIAIGANGLDGRVEVRSGDLFAALGPGERFERVVAFLPALPLPPESGAPSHAGGADGSALSARVVAEAPDRMAGDGELWLGAAILETAAGRVARTLLVEALERTAAVVSWSAGPPIPAEAIAEAAGAILSRGAPAEAERWAGWVREQLRGAGATALRPAVFRLTFGGRSETVAARTDLVQWRR